MRDSQMKTTNLLVIPCYNEEQRLDPQLVYALLDRRNISVLLVDDGSSDGTAALLDRIESESLGFVHVHRMPKNSGKAEAVRAGFNWGLERGARRIGYADADFATPPVELLRLLDALESQRLGAVLGCRVARLGAHIERKASRHLVSRLFASLASACMRVTVYDTQCGAKWFRTNAALEHAVRAPFTAHWAFDVELLGRLLGRWGDGPRLDDDDVLEIPIRAWRDVGGSKVSLIGMARALRDMLRMAIMSQRLGVAHTASLSVVPIEVAGPPHPRTSWRPSQAPRADESGETPVIGVLTVPDFPLSQLTAGAVRRTGT